MAQKQGYVLQEYLGDPQGLDAYFASLNGPAPLFTQFEDAGFQVLDTIISPSGDIASIVSAEVKTVRGKGIANRRVWDPELDAMTAAYARALFREGGTGPMNIQARKDRSGTWKAIEINLRTTGGTFARFLQGIDDLHVTMKGFAPRISFPELRPDVAAECKQVIRQYYTYPILQSQTSVLKRFNRWPADCVAISPRASCQSCSSLGCRFSGPPPRWASTNRRMLCPSLVA